MPERVLRNVFSVNADNGCIERLVGPVANVLDGFVDNLLAARYCHESPLCLVVNIVSTRFTDCHIGDTTKLFT